VQAGHFTWVEHGAYPYSTVHVDRLVDGLIVAAERGVDGGVYYVTDGPPQSSRAFCDARLQEAGVRASDRSVPRWLARGGGVDPIWWTDFYAASCSLAAASKHAGLM
jgi:nucleoside-diphosphate-sugar epimerase